VEEDEEHGDPAERVARRLDAAGRRLAEMAEAMDEAGRRQDEIQRQQAELLERLERLNRAMDRRAGDEPGT
jgi:predicted transcriptional regulator